MTVSDTDPMPVPGAPPRAVTVGVFVAFVSVCYGFGMSLFPQLLPDMRADLGFDYVFAGTVTALVQASTVVFALLAAWFVPKIGAARVVLSAVVLCGLCLAVIPLSPNLYVLASVMTLMGGTGAAAFIPMINLVSRIVLAVQRGFVMSVISSAPAYGVCFGSLIVPVLAGEGHWQSVWIVVAAITLALGIAGAIVFGRAGLFRPEPAAGPHTDVTRDGGLRGAMPWVLLIWIMSFLNGFAPYPFLGFLSPYLREELGYSVTYASAIWTMIGVVGIAAGFLAGAVSSRFGVRAALLFCYLGFLLAGLMMRFMPFGSLPFAAAVLFSVGFYPIYGLLPAYVSHRTSALTAVQVLGIATVLQGLGGTSGNYIAGFAKSETGSFSSIYLAFAACGLLCLIATLALPRQSPHVVASQAA